MKRWFQIPPNCFDFRTPPWHGGPVSRFRYAQFCPLARAAELIGGRWTLLVIRELFVGPQRFTDLRRRLRDVSSSVLASRLASLEAQGLLERRLLPPPAACSVYELSAAGRALYPAFLELTRWGLRFLSAPQPGDQLEPEWVRLGLAAFARRSPVPVCSIEVTIPAAASGVSFLVRGGESGTHLADAGPPAELHLRADALVVLGLASGALDAVQELRAGHLEVSGDPELLTRFPDLFDFPKQAETETSPATWLPERARPDHPTLPPRPPPSLLPPDSDKRVGD